MATNRYFRNFSSANEQALLDKLIIEAIQIHGHDCRYIPRQAGNFDELYGEDQIPTYSDNYELEMYVKSAEGFGGEGGFYSKWMSEIRDQVVLSVSVTRFNQEISNSRPKEADLIYFPLSGGLFVIRHVEIRPFFYQLGTLQLYDLTCELFEYSSERFDTGIPGVDALQTNFSTDEQATPSLDLDDAPNDYQADNEIFDEEGDDIIFDENNPFGDP